MLYNIEHMHHIIFILVPQRSHFILFWPVCFEKSVIIILIIVLPLVAFKISSFSLVSAVYDYDVSECGFLCIYPAQFAEPFDVFHQMWEVFRYQ